MYGFDVYGVVNPTQWPVDEDEMRSRVVSGNERKIMEDELMALIGDMEQHMIGAHQSEDYQRGGEKDEVKK